MEIKMNEATANRPEGNRLIDAPAVFINMPERIAQLKTEKAWEKNDRNGITVFKSEKITLVLTALHPGAKLDEFNSQGTTILQVQEGMVDCIVDDTNQEIGKKQMLVLHHGKPAVVTAREDSIILLAVINN